MGWFKIGFWAKFIRIQTHMRKKKNDLLGRYGGKDPKFSLAIGLLLVYFMITLEISFQSLPFGGSGCAGIWLNVFKENFKSNSVLLVNGWMINNWNEYSVAKTLGYSSWILTSALGLHVGGDALLYISSSSILIVLKEGQIAFFFFFLDGV